MRTIELIDTKPFYDWMLSEKHNMTYLLIGILLTSGLVYRAVTALRKKLAEREAK